MPDRMFSRNRKIYHIIFVPVNDIFQFNNLKEIYCYHEYDLGKNVIFWYALL